MDTTNLDSQIKHGGEELAAIEAWMQDVRAAFLRSAELYLPVWLEKACANAVAAKPERTKNAGLAEIRGIRMQLRNGLAPEWVNKSIGGGSDWLYSPGVQIGRQARTDEEVRQEVEKKLKDAASQLVEQLDGFLREKNFLDGEPVQLDALNLRAPWNDDMLNSAEDYYRLSERLEQAALHLEKVKTRRAQIEARSAWDNALVPS